MATVAPPQTPRRDFPGVFPITPAPGRSNFPAASQQQAPAYPALPPVNAQPAPTPNIPLVERAAAVINKTLTSEDLYPALDNYISQGHSSDYDIPKNQAWSPYQRVKVHRIPDEIFEQFETANLCTMMGLFADINHAWVVIDDSLYFWDYTLPTVELGGFEGGNHGTTAITAVKLLWPKEGVFIKEISRLLVIATATEMLLVGVQIEDTPTGTKKMTLFDTKMKIQTRGLGIQFIAGSQKTGRIFFGGSTDGDVYEFAYQAEEKWFQSRCVRLNHTRQGISAVVPPVPSFFSGQVSQYGHIKQIVVDDSRSVVYVLSSLSSIRVFHMKSPNTLDLSVTRTRDAIGNDLSHKVGQTALLSHDTSIVSISAITSQEAARLNLVATISNGARIYFSAVYGSIYSGDTTNAPTSMQVYHVKFPPSTVVAQAPLSGQAPHQTIMAGVPEVPRSLTPSRSSIRFPPGYFLCFVQEPATNNRDVLFMSAPDTARIAHPQDQALRGRLLEFGSFVDLGSRAEDVGLVSKPFEARSIPDGFGNELAVQYDKPVTEMAVLTNTGIHIFRRRRLVDVFAAIIRLGGDDGVDGEIRSFIRLYGRAETMACAVAVACGQGSDIANDRVIRITDENILSLARTAFVEHGGKPALDQNFALEQGAPAIESVHPSPRAEGLSHYIARLVRSIWRSKLITDEKDRTKGVLFKPSFDRQKLQGIQQELTRVQEFLEKNKTSIEGLSGPDAYSRATTRQDEIALQGEHRALSSLVELLKDTIEGLSFVLVLMDENVDDIYKMLEDADRRAMADITFEKLFCSKPGKELAKILVKAVVQRNIASGSNVDTVTDALRRKCGTFCSADDSVIYKAQEQLKRAEDGTSNADGSRALLNESLRLLSTVAGSLTPEQVQDTCARYVKLSFFAGAIQLCLTVAKEVDRGNGAQAWIQAGSPGGDSRALLFATRMRLYEVVHKVIQSVDEASAKEPEIVDGLYTIPAKRKREAYDVINDSQDELFQTSLYDWYLSLGWNDRLLEVRSPYVVAYLRRKSEENRGHADLLWRYYAHYSNFIEASRVQFGLATSEFNLTLDERIAYLGNARSNASTRTVGMADVGRPRQSRQELLREITETLEVANIQVDVLNRMREDERLDAERKETHLQLLNGQILSIDRVSIPT